jgi:hypothetical protein
MAKKKNLKAMVDEQITDMLEADAEPSEGRMKLLAIAIKKLALDAKLEESEYGEFFAEPGDTSGVPKREKPAARSRANGGADA